MRLRALETERRRRMLPEADGVAKGASGGGLRLTDDDLVDDFGPLPGDTPLDGDEDEDDDDEEEVEVDDDDDEEEEEDDEEDIEEGEEEEEVVGAEEDEDEDVVVIRQQAATATKTPTKAPSAAAPRATAQADVPPRLPALAAPPAELPTQLTQLTKLTKPAAELPNELPYVFECPQSAADLDVLMALAGRDAARQRELLHRLIAGHHAKLREANKAKLSTLAGLLIDRLVATAAEIEGGGGEGESEGGDGEGTGSGKKKKKNAAAAAAAAATAAAASPPSALLHPLCPSIFAIAQQLPVQTALTLLPRLQALWRAFHTERRETISARKRAGRRQRRAAADDAEEAAEAEGGVAAPPADPSAPIEPYVTLRPGALALLALCVQLFPLTDFRHVILTPTVLLVADVLSQPSVPSSERETRRTLFLCAIALHLSSAAGRWLPELHATASRLLGAALDARAALLADASTTALLRPLRFATLGAIGGGGDSGGAAAAALRLDAAGATFNLTHDLIRTSTNLPCFPEIWGPIFARLSAIKPNQLAKPLRPLHAACLAELRAAIPAALHARLPLLLQRAPVAPIKLYNPVFDDDFQPERSLDPDRQRAERQKLIRKTKKETKGAIRELRKDGAFLARERDKEREERDAYLEARGKRARAIMEEQEHGVKSMKKEKRRLTPSI